jgi:hypothetical protein
VTPETLYTLAELAEKTGRNYDFWDREARAGRLEYIQPGGRKGTRLTCDSAYAKWYAASLGGGRPDAVVPAPTYRQRRRDLAGFKP